MSHPDEQAHLAQLIALGMSPAQAAATIKIDGVMAHIRRSMTRREMGRLAIRALDLPIDAADLEILMALQTGKDTNGEATVGYIAERLNVDPSRASRVVADAVDKGLVRRVASQSDARRIGLELTETGKSHAAAIRQYKWGVFAEALGDWPEEDLVTFARLFERFSGWVAEAKEKAAKD